MKPTCKIVLLFFLAVAASGCNARPTPSATAPTPTPPTLTILPQTSSTVIYLYPTATDHPHITDTPTVDDAASIDHYLTPFTPIPGQTAQTPTASITPRPTITQTSTRTKPATTDIPDKDILSQITAQQPAPNWTPTPPPLVDGAVVQDIYAANPVDKKIAAWRIAYIQAATDLMNFTHADKDVFLKHVDGWTVDTWSARGHTTWFVENDFDHDGQSEWLVNIPLYSSDPKAFCCSQLMLIFEKMDGLYHPVYDQAGGGLDIDWHIMEIADFNKDGNLEIVTSQSCHYCDAPPPIINIGAWDGSRWHNEGNIDGQIIFADTDENGTAKLVTQGAHTYRWQNGQFKLIEEKQPPQPSFDPYQAVADVHKALMAHNPKEAIRLAEPILQRLRFSCDEPKSYTALEEMFTYALDNQPQAVENTANQIKKSCQHSNNGQMARVVQIFWAAYQKTHNAILSCQAMNRFWLEKKSELFIYTYYSSVYPLCSDNEIKEHP